MLDVPNVYIEMWNDAIFIIIINLTTNSNNKRICAVTLQTIGASVLTSTLTSPPVSFPIFVTVQLIT